MIYNFFPSQANRLLVTALFDEGQIKVADDIWRLKDEIGFGDHYNSMDLSALAEILSEPQDGSQFKQVCGIVGLRGKDSADLIPILEKLDHSSEPWIRRAAAQTIDTITDRKRR